MNDIIITTLFVHLRTVVVLFDFVADPVARHSPRVVHLATRTPSLVSDWPNSSADVVIRCASR